MTADDVFFTEIEQEIRVGPSFGVEPGKYYVKSAIATRRKHKLFILGYLLIKNEELILAAARQP